MTLTKEETAERLKAANEAGLTVVNRSTGGHPFVSSHDLPDVDPAEFEVSAHYAKNIFPWGVTIGQSATTWIQDRENLLKELEQNAEEVLGGMEPIRIYNSMTIKQPDVNKERYLVTNNPDSYGTYESLYDAVEQAMRVLKAERTKCLVESELQYATRIAANLESR